MRRLPGLMLVLLAAGSAHAQAIAGRVLDAETGRPVADASIELRNAAGAVMGRTVTDSAGAFAIAGRGPGRYTLRVVHVAYLEYRSQGIQLPYMETVMLDVRISSTAIPLEAITVRSRSRANYHAPTYDGLYARMDQLPRVGSNRIIMKGDLELRSVMRASELIDRYFYDVRRRGTPCVVWNGMMMSNPAIAEMRLDVSVDDLEAIEVYRDYLLAPMQFRDPVGLLQTVCPSVIILWPLRPDLPGRKR
jgi:5-hydroxyisourate hydrolase-like protein (transthyretin family)